MGDQNAEQLDVNNNNAGDGDLLEPGAGAGGLGHQVFDLDDFEDPGRVVWRRTGPVERLPNGMWRRLTGKLKRIIYPSS